MNFVIIHFFFNLRCFLPFIDSFFVFLQKRNTTIDDSSHLMQLANAVLPESIDWRTKGAVTDVEEQGKCGSCWAFSILGALESQQFRKTGHLIQLSPQNLVDCANAKHKCEGQSRHNAMDYIKRNGVETERMYPYRAVGGKCKYNRRKSVATLKGYRDLPEGDETRLQQAIANVGPISVCVDASHKSFQHYSGGIYYEPKCGSSDDDLDHAVLVVGYSTDRNGKDYYIVKNSWGEDWGRKKKRFVALHFFPISLFIQFTRFSGEKGYMKLARNQNNHCGVATIATYPIV